MPRAELPTDVTRRADVVAALGAPEAPPKPGASAAAPTATVVPAAAPAAVAPTTPGAHRLAATTWRRVATRDARRSAHGGLWGALSAMSAEVERRSHASEGEPSGAEPSVDRAAAPSPRIDATTPWVVLERLAPPATDPEGRFDSARRERQIGALEPWFRCQGVVEGYSEPPPYVEVDERSPFRVRPPPDSEFARAVKTIARKKFYREVRRAAKRQWRRLYQESSTMTFDRYEGRLLRINRLGRDDDYDVFGSEYYANRLRDDVFEEPENEGERDVSLLAWGPFVVLDSGSLRFDLGRALDLDADRVDHVGIGEPDTSPAVKTGGLRFDTRVRLHLDPTDVVDHDGDATWLVKRYGATVTLDWLSGILARELVSTEIEARVDRDGDFAVAVNFVITSR